MSTPAELLAAWLNGTPTGGPESDGRYPLVYQDGETYLVYCPAAQALNPSALEQPIEVFSEAADAAAEAAAASATAANASKIAAAASASSAAASATSANTKAVLANGSATTASTAATNATTAKTAAETAQAAATASATAADGSATAAAGSASAAATSATDATTAKTAAEAARDLAEDWANTPEDVVVTGGLYSAFHWAQKALDAMAGGGGDGASLSVANIWTAIQTFARDTVVSRVSQAVDTYLKLDGDNGYAKRLTFHTGGVIRWSMHSSNNTEAGADAGSSLVAAAYSDAGALLGTAWIIPRATQIVGFTQTPTFPTATAGDNTTKGATTGFVQAMKTALLGAANSWGGIQTIYAAGGVSGLLIDSDASPQQTATVAWRRGGLNRWQWQLVGDETGVANGGGTLSLRHHADAGTQIGASVNVDRPTGIWTFVSSPLVPTPATTDSSTKAANTAFVGAYSSKKKTLAVLASPVSSSSTTAADIASWSVSVVAGKKYLLKIIGMYSSAATTTGCKLQMVSSGGAAGTAVGYIEGGINRANTSPLSTVVKNIAGSYGLITSGNGVVGDMCHLTAEIFIDCTTSGTVTFQWGSEVAASAAQLEAGSVLITEEF